jgi:TRAP-type C4-dicarboxylate transport system permease small subunit
MTPAAGRDDGVLAALCRGAETLAIVLLGVMTAFIVVQVAARNVFELGLPWAEELARYAGLGVVYFTVPLLLLQDQHIRVDLLSGRLRGRSAVAMRVAIELVVVAFGASFLWAGWLFLQRAGRFSTAALGIPNWIYYLPAAIGMLLFTVVALQRLLRAAGDGPAAPASASESEPSR